MDDVDDVGVVLKVAVDADADADSVAVVDVIDAVNAVDAVDDVLDLCNAPTPAATADILGAVAPCCSCICNGIYVCVVMYSCVRADLLCCCSFYKQYSVLLAPYVILLSIVIEYWRRLQCLWTT